MEKFKNRETGKVFYYESAKEADEKFDLLWNRAVCRLLDKTDANLDEWFEPKELEEYIALKGGVMEDIDQEAIAEMIKDGYTSGRIDNGAEGKHIWWELKTEEWKDD